MDAIDDEYERAQKFNNNAQKVYVSAIAKMEDGNEAKIKDALSRLLLGDWATLMYTLTYIASSSYLPLL